MSGIPNSGCTQVAFDRSGSVVIVEEQQADVITTYTRNRDGTLSQPTPQQSTGNGPFGLTFTQRNQLLTTENFGALPGQGGLAAYAIDERTGTLSPLSPTVRNGSVGHVLGRHHRRQPLRLHLQLRRRRRHLELPRRARRQSPAAGPAGSHRRRRVSDVALSRNSRYLYVKNTLEGTVTTFQIEQDGALTELDSDRDDSMGGGSIGLAAT